MSLSSRYESRYEFEGQRFLAIASVRDFQWGKGLRIQLVQEDGPVLGVVIFGCNPGRPDFARWNALDHQTLFLEVVDRLAKGQHADVKEAVSHGLTLHLSQ